MKRSILRAAWALAVVPVLLLAACSSPTATLRLAVSADADVGALSSLTAYVRVGDDDAARVESLDVPFNPARDLGVEPYVLQVDVPDGSPFAAEAYVAVIGSSNGTPAATWMSEHDLRVVETVDVTLTALGAACDQDKDGFKDCDVPSCCSVSEKGDWADCDDAQAKENPFADQPACRDCRDLGQDGVADCLQAPAEPTPEVVEPSSDASDALHDAVDVDSSHDAQDADATADVSDADLEAADVPDASDVDASDPGQDHDAIPDAAETELGPDGETVDAEVEADVCTPDCTDKICGDDGCGGSCGGLGRRSLGEGGCPTGKACVLGSCVCPDECSPSGKKECTDGTHFRTCGDPDSDTCLEWSPVSACTTGSTCDGGVCACTPSCTGKLCGDDGCGGSCGSCSNGKTCDAGQCVCGGTTDATCNNVDDDCNGQTDEDYVATPTACGVGACARTGALGCSNGVEVDSCSAGTPAASDASCNTIDDDCSGQTDEDYVPVSTCFKPGACAALNHASSCSGGVVTPCKTGTPGTEECNNADDDCDGTTDDGGDALCGLGETCQGASGCVCLPDCTGRVCGDDGCGGSCGTCGIDQVCSGEGACAWNGTTCGGVTCPALAGYTLSCNAQAHCEYTNLDPTGWKQHDVWIWVPPGSFTMGSPPGEVGHQANEEPQHTVTFAKGYFVGKYEVPVETYEACKAGPHSGVQCTAADTTDWTADGWGTNTSANGRSTHPQNGLTWDQAGTVCTWLGGRRPSEAEWEYAATGPTHRLYPWGDTPAASCSANVAVYNEDASGTKPWGCDSCQTSGCSGTKTVGSKTSGAAWSGALDMAGNVWEWCEDGYHGDFTSAPANGSAWVSTIASARIRRGGAFTNGALYLRSASRVGDTPSRRVADFGARCVRDLPLTCGGVECPFLGGYKSACNAQAHCEYTNLDPTGWKQHDVWIWVPPGSFSMGSPATEAGHQPNEEPQHTVTFAKGYFVAKHEVTVAEYEACMAESPGTCTAPSTADFDGAGWGTNTSANERSAHPQNGLTWDQAGAACAWLGGRRPSEAEWEYAATGPTHRKYPWGTTEPTCAADVAVVDEDNSGTRPWGCNSCTTSGCSGTSPVGSKAAGAAWCGATDMVGNVWEWAEDWWHETYDGGPSDGSAWVSPGSSYRVIRQGSFAGSGLRSSNRHRDTPSLRRATYGARCVRDLPGSVEVTPGFVAIPAGTFWMGSPGGEACPSGYAGGGCPGSGMTAAELGHSSDEALHYVKLTTAFEMQAKEVTQGEWKTTYGGWNPSAFTACGDTCPVEQVNWYEVVAYANARSVAAGKTACYAFAAVTCRQGGNPADPTNYRFCMDGAHAGINSATVTLNGVATPYLCTGYRLPTESEWEYAYRAGGVTAIHASAGNDGTVTKTDCTLDGNLDQIGWYCGNASNTTHITGPGGGKEANAWGIYDMAGNVWEWCWDWYAATYPAGTVASPAKDPVGGEGSYRQIRGGSWNYIAGGARAAARRGGGLGSRDGDLGARLARSVP